MLRTERMSPRSYFLTSPPPPLRRSLTHPNTPPSQHTRTLRRSLLVLFFFSLTKAFPLSRLSVSSSSLLMAAAASSGDGGSTEGLCDIGSSSSGGTISGSSSPIVSSMITPSSSPHRWVQALDLALEKNKADMHSRFMQLATIGQPEASAAQDEEEEVSGDKTDFYVRPHVRWVVFRGFLHDNTTTLKVITDSRSEKVKDLRSNPFGELSWYFVQSREQFRLAGKCHLVMAGEGDAALAAAREAQWTALSDNARLQFIWPLPGAPQEEDSMTEEMRKVLFNPPPPAASSSPPDTFVLLLFHPSRVDHLQLRPNPQVRTVHDQQRGKLRVGGNDGEAECVAASEEWLTRRVNP